SEFSQCVPMMNPNYLVNSTGDGGDSNLGDFVCDDGAGNCTLRAAIQQANNDGSPSVITFAPALAGATIQPATQLTGLHEGGTTTRSARTTASPSTTASASRSKTARTSPSPPSRDSCPTSRASSRRLTSPRRAARSAASRGSRRLTGRAAPSLTTSARASPG